MKQTWYSQLFKASNRNTRKKCEIWSQLTLVFPSLTLGMYFFGKCKKMKFFVIDFFSKCGFGHIYWRNPSWKIFFYCLVSKRKNIEQIKSRSLLYFIQWVFFYIYRCNICIALTHFRDVFWTLSNIYDGVFLWK